MSRWLPALLLAALCACGRPPGAGSPDAGLPDAQAPDASTADSGAPIADAGLAELEAFCDGLAEDACAYRVRCGLAHSLEGCLQLLADEQLLQPCLGPERDSLLRGAARFAPERAAACRDQLRDAGACQDVPFSALPGCGVLVSGRVQEGGACALDHECAGDAFCAADGGSCPGACARRKPLGAPAGRDGECGQGAYVFDGRCAAPVPLGGSCAPTPFVGYPRCADGSYCDRYGALVCLASQGLTAPCPTGFECAFPLRCTAHGCEPARQLGESCSRAGPWSDGRSCVSDLFCDALPNGSAGQCAPRRDAPGSCYERGDCRPGLLCRRGASELAPGTCVLPLALGASCNPFSEGQCAQTLFCPLNAADPRCSARVEEGQACGDGAFRECQPGLACAGGRCVKPWCQPP